MVNGNTIIDPWANTSSVASAVFLRSSNNTVVIAGNTLQAGTKTATKVNESGIRASSTVSCVVIDGGGNNFIAATTALIGVTTILKAAFFGVAPIVKPTVTGAKGSNVALGSLIAGLVSLGLSADTTTP
jgi:hypothetical protein